jgi:hypothetical protein
VCHHTSYTELLATSILLSGYEEKGRFQWQYLWVGEGLLKLHDKLYYLKMDNTSPGKMYYNSSIRETNSGGS